MKSFKKRRCIVSLIALIALLLIPALLEASSNLFVGRKVKDPYPLQHLLDYTYTGTNDWRNPVELTGRIVEGLDIENNERYFKTGVIYRNGKVYEIPMNEVEDFGLEISHKNTYCNIFVMDVLNILSNTLKDTSYRTWKKPIRANDMRYTLENSNEWVEIAKEDAGRMAREGNIVILSYKKSPTGHVAIVRPESTESKIMLWNVGATNSSNWEWKVKGDTKYFMKR